MQQADATDRHSDKANLAGAIYGTIVSMTVVATASKDVSLGPIEIAAWAAITGIVFWLVHVYADIVAAGYSTPSRSPQDMPAEPSGPSGRSCRAR